MKPKFKITIGGKGSCIVEAWNASAAAYEAIRNRIAVKQNMEIGDKTTIEIERIA